MSQTAISTPLAQRLLCSPLAETVVAPYRLARLVARVLVSEHLRQRRKWCDLALVLSADPAVERRLIDQAIRWLQMKKQVSNHPQLS